MIITIDGPAGSGKSTAARELAKALGIAYLDTGATYRAVTHEALRRGVNLQDEDALAALTGAVDIELLPQPGGVRVMLDGRDVSREVRSAEVTDNIHYAAGSPKTRAVLVELQRRIGGELGSFVSEGRDQGSVVFPNADFRFYLDASPDVRARRRFEEMRGDGLSASMGSAIDFHSVLASILQRDERDRTRAVAPLTKPAGAIEIDTSGMTITQVVDELLRCVRIRP